MTPGKPTARPRIRRRRIAQVVLMVLSATVVWYGIAWVRRIPAAEPLAVIAHRGGPAGSDAPEGTVAAFEASIKAGADWLEFDVRSTADGALVVLHDATVDRTTNGTGSITALTLAEAQALDAGGGAQIPTVEAIVDLASNADIPILPEIKDAARNPGLTAHSWISYTRRATWTSRSSRPSSRRRSKRCAGWRPMRRRAG